MRWDVVDGEQHVQTEQLKKHPRLPAPAVKMEGKLHTFRQWSVENPIHHCDAAEDEQEVIGDGSPNLDLLCRHLENVL
jgi:hypothetical protein